MLSNRHPECCTFCFLCLIETEAQHSRINVNKNRQTFFNSFIKQNKIASCSIDKFARKYYDETVHKTQRYSFSEYLHETCTGTFTTSFSYTRNGGFKQ